MTTTSEEILKYQIALTLIPNVGHVIAKSIVGYCGSVENVFKEKISALEKIPGVGSVIAKSIHQFKDFERPEKEVEFVEKYKITPLFYLDKNYPVRLKNCIDAPVMLYYKGNTDLNAQRFIAFVGTRKATEYGKLHTEKIIEELASHKVVVVSGLAYGIDITAHKVSLKNNVQTIGVLAHGLDTIYPGVHRSIAQKMVEQGGLLTEYMSKTNPDRENFPSRNRIIAGISDAVVVMEAAESGGALITAIIANSYNRDVFAFPGRADDYYSKGCNGIIKLNKAGMIENAADIIFNLGWENQEAKKSVKKQRELFIELNPDEKTVLHILNQQPQLNIDNIVAESNLSMSKVAAALLNLEFSGYVKSLPGKIYIAL